MFDSALQYWEETMQIPEARWIVLLTILAIFVLVGVYVAMYFRGHATGTNRESSDYLSDFRKLKNEGKLNDEEFGKLKEVIPREMVPDATGEASALPDSTEYQAQQPVVPDFRESEELETRSGQKGEKAGD